MVVAMRVHGLSYLAGADSDLDTVPGVIRYGPS